MRWTGALLLVACTGGSLSTGGDAGRTPLNHRVDDSACTSAPGPGSCSLMGGPPGECASDAACTMGKNGRCVENNGGALFCRCSYDACTHDTDCPTGQLCACHGSPYTNGGNACITGTCRVDADCPGSFCSPSGSTTNCGGLGGYYCHTAHDECTDDADCGTQNGPQFCAWSANDQHWKCQPELLCA